MLRKAGDIMSTPVISVSLATTAVEIAEKLGMHGISAVPVVDASQHVVGLVSEHDLLAKAGVTAAEIMTTAVISVTADTDVSAIRHLLVDQRIRRVPVIETDGSSVSSAGET